MITFYLTFFLERFKLYMNKLCNSRSMIQTNDKALSLLLWSVQVFVYEKIKNIEQFCVFWYITMTMKFNLFRY